MSFIEFHNDIPYCSSVVKCHEMLSFCCDFGENTVATVVFAIVCPARDWLT
jgi:hypothetical protein